MQQRELDVYDKIPYNEKQIEKQISNYWILPSDLSQLFRTEHMLLSDVKLL